MKDSRSVLLTLILAIYLYPSNLFAANNHAPILKDLGELHYKIASKSLEAQRYFEQGLILFYDFDFAESVRSFKAAIQEDKKCGMCYFGLGLALSSKTDTPLTGFERRQAVRTIKQGLLLSNLTEKEEDLLYAVSNRLFRGENKEKHSTKIYYHHNELLSTEERYSFMDSMKKLAKKHPDDNQIQAIFAYSLYDLSDNKFFDKKDKTPGKFTNELLDVLGSVLAKTPNHPGAMHLYIHVIEQSNNPDEASQVANRLLTAYPNLPHLSHMPSRIYVLTGRLHDASDANLQAIAAFERYKATCHDQGFTPAPNYLEQSNYQALWISASLEGRYELAKHAAEKVKELTPPFLIKQDYSLQHFHTVEYLNEVRFKHWEHVLAFQEPEIHLQFQRGLWYYAAGMALTYSGRIPEAKQALTNLTLITERGENDEVLNTFGFNQLVTAQAILSAVIAEKQGKRDLVLHYWKAAQASLANHSLVEPPIWFLETYRGLGHAYTLYKQEGKAMQTLGSYLDKFPKSPWVYPDIEQLLVKLDRAHKAEETRKDFLKLWRYSDVSFPG